MQITESRENLQHIVNEYGRAWVRMKLWIIKINVNKSKVLLCIALAGALS